MKAVDWGVSSESRAIWGNVLGRRLLKAMLLFATAVVLLLSAIELYLEYRVGLGAIERRLDEIQTSHASAAADRLWAVDSVGVWLLAKGISALPAIRYVDIRESSGHRQHTAPVTIGEAQGAHSLSRTIPLVLVREEQAIKIGELRVEATLEELHAHLVRRGFMILAEQSAKSLLLAAFFLLVIHRFVVARISTISARIADFGCVVGSEPYAKGDEIDRMQDIFEAMKEGIAVKDAGLCRSLAFSESVIHAMPDLLFEMDRRGTYLNVWTRQPELLAAPPEELLGRTAAALLPDDAARTTMDCLREADETGLSTGKVIRIDLPQGPAWFELSCAKMPAQEGQEPHFLTISRDITARKLDEDRIKEKAQAYRALAESSPDNIVRYDKQIRVRYLNTRLATTLGVNSVNYIIGKRPSEIWPGRPMDAEIEQAAKRACETGDTVSIELTPAPGVSHHVLVVPERDETGCIVGAIAFGRDVSELMRMKREMLRLERAINRSADGFFVIASPSRIVDVNDTACRMLGYSREELLGMTVGDIDPDYTPSAMEPVIRAMEPGRSYSTERRHRTKAGTVFPVEISKSSFDDEGERYFIVSARDISERKLVEDTLRFIADPSRKTKDSDFLSALAVHLSETLDVAYVIIDRLAEQPGIAETVALCVRGQIQPNMRYSLAGTPCADVADSRFCIYSSGVQELFPEDVLLVDMGAHSYVGAPLLDTTGRPIGLIAILDTVPLRNESLTSQLLRIVTPRAAAELERAESDRKLALREQQYRSLAEGAPDNIIRYDRDLRIRYLNKRLMKALNLTSSDEVVGKRAAEAWPDGRFDAIEQASAQAMERGEVISVELKVAAGLHHVLVLPERDETGAIIGTIAFGRDVTELVRIDHERHLLQHAVDQSPDTFFVIQDNGRIAAVNDTTCRVLGYSQDEFMKMTVTDIDPDYSPEDVQKVIASLVRGRTTLFETHHRAKDGRTFPVEITVSLFEDGEERSCIAVARDITERKRLETELVRRELQFRSLAENSPDVIVRYDRQCRRVYVNPAYEMITECAVDRVLGTVPDHTWKGSIPVGDYLALIREVLETGSRARTRMVWNNVRTHDDIVYDLHVIPELDPRNEISGALVIGRDITKLVEMERQYHTLVENLPDEVLRLDRDLHLQFGNAAVLARLQKRLEDVVGKPLAEVVPTDHVAILAEAGHRALEEGRPNTTEVIFKGRKRVATVEIRHIPEFDAAGTVTSVLGIGRDISERKAKEEIERQLMQAQKFEALGQLAGNVAHDFNNLLGAILGFADLIIDQSLPSAPCHRLAGRIAAAGEHGRRLVSQILTFARRAEMRFAGVSLMDAIEETLMLLTSTLPATSRLIVSAGENSCTVLGDRGQLVHMLVNLCINAHHALNGAHGEITLAAGDAIDGGEPTLRLRGRDGIAAEAVDVWRDADGTAHAVIGRLMPNRQYRVLRVSDTGCGMDEYLLGQIFTPFFTTKGANGTGLGLAAVHGTVLAHHGALAVESRLGLGTIFDVFLPAADETQSPPPRSSSVESDDAPILPDGLRILLVDDDPHFCDMLFAVLESLGCEVAPCSDPREALEAIDEFGCSWDVVISDQTMPYMTGLELIRAVRERCPTLPCILCTGFSEEDLDDEGLRRASVSALLRKPLDQRALISALAKAVTHRMDSDCAGTIFS